MAHLYQAARVESQCVAWPDMEFVIGSQTADHIFFGGRPTTFEQCCLKCELASGLSIRNRNAMTNLGTDPIFSERGIRVMQLDDMPFNTLFSNRGWGLQPSHIQRTVENLELLLNSALHGVDVAKFKQDGEGNLISRAELLKLTSRKPKATIRQLLAVLEEELMHEASTLHFDFWSFRLECCLLLEAIDARVTPAWERAIGKQSHESAIKPSYIVTFEILSKAKVSKLMERLPGGFPQLSTRCLNEVAVMLEEHIQKHGRENVNALKR